MNEQIIELRTKLTLLQKEEKHHSNISKLGLSACINCPSKKKCKLLSIELAEIESIFLSRKK